MFKWLAHVSLLYTGDHVQWFGKVSWNVSVCFVIYNRLVHVLQCVLTVFDITINDAYVYKQTNIEQI